MKILADVNVSRRVVERLRRDGFDVARVPELLDARASDEEVVQAARSMGAILLSHDQDISALLAVGTCQRI